MKYTKDTLYRAAYHLDPSMKDIIEHCGGPVSLPTILEMVAQMQFIEMVLCEEKPTQIDKKAQEIVAHALMELEECGRFTLGDEEYFFDVT